MLREPRLSLSIEGPCAGVFYYQAASTAEPYA